ncbi:MAG: phosphopantetheine-binding protein [Thermocrispum sp.]
MIAENAGAVVEGARGREITGEMSLRDDFGADSLEVVEVVSRSMKQLRIRVPRTELAKAANIKELVDVFEESAAV